jgi:hypothetical protein
MPKSSFSPRLRSRSLAAVFFLFSVAGCRDVTAPQARDAIEKTEAQVLKGNFTAFNGPLGHLIFETAERASRVGAGKYAALTPTIPSSRVQVVRNGESVTYIATILERVYVPARAMGGIPLVRRTLMAWSADGSEEVLVATAEDPTATVTLPLFKQLADDNLERLFGTRGYVVYSRGKPGQPWFGREGTIAFTDTEVEGPCPPRIMDAYSGYPPDTSAKCVSSMTGVQVNATLQRGNPEQPGLASLLRPDLDSLQIDAPEITTIRITTRCTGDAHRDPQYCWTPLAFWRKNAQFDASIGLDVRRLSRTYEVRPQPMGHPPLSEWGNELWQMLEPGVGDEIACCANYNGPMSYRILSPDGKVIRSASPSNAWADSTLRTLPMNVLFRPGARRLFLVGSGIAGNPADQKSGVMILEMNRPR